jgi:chromosome partitioning protein
MVPRAKSTRGPMVPRPLKSRGPKVRRVYKSNQGRGGYVRTIAVLNLKGGSGKTTTALNLAVGLARALPKKKRVLLVDGDASANATMTILDGHAAAAPTLGQVLLKQAEASEAIRPTRVPQLDVLPAAGSLANAALQLGEEWGREQRLRTALRTVEASYELCIIDSPPSMSLLSVNILQAATDVIVPVDSGIYSLAGLVRLNDVIALVRENLDHAALHIIGLVLTKVMRTKVKGPTPIESQLREAYGALVYRTVIHYDAKIEESATHHRSVLEFDPSSEAAVEFNGLIEEVLNNGRKQARPRRSAPKSEGNGDARKKRRAG